MPFGIRKSGTKWKVINKKTNRVLGTHITKTKAQKQLTAIAINYKPKRKRSK